MKIGSKITIWVVLVLIATSSIAAYFFYRVQIGAEFEKINVIGRMTADIIEESIFDFMQTRDLDALNRHLARLQEGSRPLSKICVVNSHGTIMAGTDPLRIGKRMADYNVQCQDCHETRPEGRFMPKQNMLRWINPVRNLPKCYGCHDSRKTYNGAVVVFISLEETMRHVRDQIIAGIAIMASAIAAIGGLMIVLSNVFVTRRLQSVIKRTRKITEGDYSIVLRPEGDDEITRLEEHLGEMAKAVRERDREKDLLYQQILRAYNQWQETFDSVTDMIAVLDSDLMTVSTNKTFDAFFGLTEETRDINLCDLLFGETAERPSCFDRDRPSSADLEFKPKGKTLRINAFPYEFLSSDMKGLIVILRDVTEEKHKEMERETLIVGLKEALDTVSHAQKEWSETFDAITDLIYIVDPSYTILRANRAFAGYFGLAAEDVVGRKCYEIFHGTSSPPGCPHASALDTKAPAMDEFIDPRTNKTFLVTAFPRTGYEGLQLGSICIARDVTTEREQEMRLMMSERLASLGQMASGIAHEINNPLAAIAGCAEGLMFRVNAGRYDPEFFRNYLSIIYEEIARCKGITTSMLSFIRQSAYETTAVDINALLEKTVEIVGFQGRLLNIEIVKRYSESAPPVQGNEGELRQALLILVLNAVDAMDEKGTLTLETGSDGKTVSVSISDTGTGIPPENLGRIFDLFFTTKLDRGGTGLGLSIANRIVTNHKGHIAVTSIVEKGSTFKITLPAAGGG